MKHVFGLVLILTLFNSCGKNNISPGPELIQQEILFQFEFINHAWGYQHRGWLIASSGNVYCYDSPENWTFCDNEGFISESAMSQNIEEANSICLQIERHALAAKFVLIEGASEGEISDPVNEMYDAGISGYFGFVYDPNERVYQRILLKQIGDFRIDNNSEEASVLYQWLDQIDQEINNSDN
jgi:hypothetical protein